MEQGSTMAWNRVVPDGGPVVLDGLLCPLRVSKEVTIVEVDLRIVGHCLQFRSGGLHHRSQPIK